jgi:hypothetical protein
VKKSVRTAALLLLAGALVATAACQPPSKPIKFNNEMARSNDGLLLAAKAFRRILKDEVMAGKEGGAKRLRGQYDNIAVAVKELRKKYDRVRPPIGSAQGRVLLEKYREFLDDQQKMVDGPLLEIVTIAESGNLDGATVTKIEELKAKILEEEGRSINVLTEAQNLYAEEKRFKPQ